MFKGLRFQKRLSILPGVRINLSKSGPSASIGPRGADVNIGAHGVTTNAGIPGTGLSYRSKLGGGRGALGILAVVAGLGWWAFNHAPQIAQFFAPSPAAQVAQTHAAMASTPVQAASTSLRYVHRAGSILREEPKSSGRTLKKESKGASIVLLAEANGWAQVRDGDLTGWMRSSVLGANAPD